MLNSHKYTTIFLSRNTFFESIPFQLHTLLLMLNLRLTYLGRWSISTNQQEFLSFINETKQKIWQNEGIIHQQKHTIHCTVPTYLASSVPVHWRSSQIECQMYRKMDSYPIDVLLEQGSKKVINDLHLFRFLHLTNSPPFNQENS